MALGALSLVLASLAAAVSHGQQPSEQTAAARALFDEGMAAVDAREWATATDRLRRSLALRDSIVVRTNLALALIEAGELVEASEHLRTVQRQSEAGSDAHGVATETLATIAPRLGRLQIDVGGARDDVEVRIDGRPIPSALIGVPHPADPGRHRVTLHRGERELAAREVAVESGALASVSLIAAPAPIDEQPVGATDAAAITGGGIEREWWFWTLIGGLAIGAGVAIALAVTLSDNNGAAPWLVGDDGVTHMTLRVGWP